MEHSANFIFTLDGIPYIVTAKLIHFNSEPQYQVSINNADEVLFTFNKDLGRYAPVGDDAVNIPDNLELEIGAKLNSASLQK